MEKRISYNPKIDRFNFTFQEADENLDADIIEAVRGGFNISEPEKKRKYARWIFMYFNFPIALGIHLSDARNLKGTLIDIQPAKKTDFAFLLAHAMRLLGTATLNEESRNNLLIAQMLELIKTHSLELSF